MSYDDKLRKDLVALCDARGLPAYGNKAELAARLNADDETKPPAAPANPPAGPPQPPAALAEVPPPPAEPAPVPMAGGVCGVCRPPQGVHPDATSFTCAHGHWDLTKGDQ